MQYIVLECSFDFYPIYGWFGRRNLRRGRILGPYLAECLNPVCKMLYVW